MSSTDIAAVTEFVSRWWFDYDEGNFDAWPDYFTHDARFTCRSDSGETAFEEFIRADISGGDEVVRWQTEHRRNSPYPLRHNSTNLHVTARRNDEVDARFYLFVTQITQQKVDAISTGVCEVTLRAEGEGLRIAALSVVLDFTDSELFSAARS